MRKVTCSMGVSLDGYISGPDGGFAWSTPDEDVFRFATEEVRGLAVHLLGRRLYETMSYWGTVDQASLSDLEREFAAVWAALPKVVFSNTLDAVVAGYRLATGGLAEEIEAWRAKPGPGHIGIGGAALAAEAAVLGLVDEYRLRVHPVLVGGGTPIFPGLNCARIWTLSRAGRSTQASFTFITACVADSLAVRRCSGTALPCAGNAHHASNSVMHRQGSDRFFVG